MIKDIKIKSKFFEVINGEANATTYVCQVDVYDSGFIRKTVLLLKAVHQESQFINPSSHIIGVQLFLLRQNLDYARQTINYVGHRPLQDQTQTRYLQIAKYAIKEFLKKDKQENCSDDPNNWFGLIAFNTGRTEQMSSFLPDPEPAEIPSDD